MEKKKKVDKKTECQQGQEVQEKGILKNVHQKHTLKGVTD